MTCAIFGSCILPGWTVFGPSFTVSVVLCGGQVRHVLHVHLKGSFISRYVSTDNTSQLADNTMSRSHDIFIRSTRCSDSAESSALVRSVG